MEPKDNQLTIVSKIETQLRQRREQNVFPLTPTHRKELRQLRDANVGELTTQLRFIKKEKLDSFKVKYRKNLEELAQKGKGICEDLNKDWKKIKTQIKKLLDERKKLEEKNMPNYSTVSNSYENVHLFNEQRIDEYLQREITFDIENSTKSGAEKEFDEEYGEGFKKVQEQIDQINTAYEEAINFGDLEIVKELYYKMKDADQFLEKIRKIKV